MSKRPHKKTTKRTRKPTKAKANGHANKQFLLKVRVTSEQRDLIRGAAEETGVSLSTWVRMAALKVSQALKVPQSPARE